MKGALHAIFIDGDCPFCIATALKIIGWDREKKFKFCALQDAKAKKYLQELYPDYNRLNTVVLLENYLNLEKSRIWLRGRAIFRIFWCLGGAWRLAGWLCFIPLGMDWGYRFIASRRDSLLLKRHSFKEIPLDRLL